MTASPTSSPTPEAHPATELMQALGFAAASKPFTVSAFDDGSYSLKCNGCQAVQSWTGKPPWMEMCEPAAAPREPSVVTDEDAGIGGVEQYAALRRVLDDCASRKGAPTCVERDCGWYRTTVELRATIAELRRELTHNKEHRLETGEFHNRDGVFFKRLEDGSVRLRIAAGGPFGPTHDIRHVIRPKEWASIVAAVAKGDQAENFTKAQELHGD